MFFLEWIMPPKVMTQSADRPTVAPRGGGTGRRVGRKGKRVREPRRRKVKPTGEPKGQGNDQGVEVNEGVDGGDNRNQNGTAINDNIYGDVRNVIVINSRRGCTYKEFLACNPKEYDGNGGFNVVEFPYLHTKHEVAVSMEWDDFKVLMREEFCPSKERQKLETELWNHAMVGTGHAAYTNRFHDLSRSVKKSHEKRGNEGEPSKDRNVRDDNKRSRTVSAFATTLFDSRADYSFVSTTFIPLLGIEPSDLGFSHETEITSRQLVEIDKVTIEYATKNPSSAFPSNFPKGSWVLRLVIRHPKGLINPILGVLPNSINCLSPKGNG
nr:reverse transcriptase domain-containing protein [Tanacetum cinerariifolium]